MASGAASERLMEVPRLQFITVVDVPVNMQRQFQRLRPRTVEVPQVQLIAMVERLCVFAVTSSRVLV